MTSIHRAYGVAAALAIVVVSAPAVAGAVGTLTVESPAARATVIELYTSEGCSSCPPADDWLEAFRADPGLWRDIIPVAFHVDYWDYIGWEDRFASPRHADRQRDYARAWNDEEIYTPEFVVNGREWRGLFEGAPLVTGGGADVGVLRAAIDGDRADVTFAPTNDVYGALDAHVVVLGFGLTSDVTAGENEGLTLAHDFVVLGHETEKLKFGDGVYRGRAEVPRAGSTGAEATATAVAVWVSARSGAPTPIQAAGGWLEVSETHRMQPKGYAIVKSEDEWKKQLTPEQYRVTREKGTERAFTGEYYNHKGEGMYKCVCCGNPLFASDTKYESGSGWPSFYAPVDADNVREVHDNSHGMIRTEVVCSRCGAHLGHVFSDGPKPTGQRYCINSVSLQFEGEGDTPEQTE